MYTPEQRIAASKRLTKCNLDIDFPDVTCTTYWCHIRYAFKEKHNEKTHAHSHYEMQVVLSGRCELEFEGQSAILERGEFIWFPRKEKHRILWESEDFSKFVWAFNMSEEQSAMCDSVLYPLRVYDGDSVLPMMIDVCMFNEDFMSRKASLYAIFLSVLNTIKPPIDNFSVDRAHDERFKGIRMFITDNIESDLTVSMVCRQFYLSEKQLSRICFDNCGMTLGKFIKHIRFERIRFLLRNTDFLIKEIAAMVGYADEFAMSKAFKAEEGVSPRCFRERARA